MSEGASVPPQIVARHGAALRELARVLVGDSGDAEDVVQETWVRFLEARPKSGALGGWLTTVLRRLASNKRRERARRSAREAMAASSATFDESRMLEREESLRAVVEAVLALEEPYKTVVWMRWFDGLAPREIASLMGVDASVIHTRLARAHAKLRERLSRDLGPERSLALLGLLAGNELHSASIPMLVTVGGMLMGSKLSVAAVAIVALAAAIAWWSSDDVAEPIRSANSSVAAAEPPAREFEQAPSGVAATERIAAESASESDAEISLAQPDWPAPRFEYEIEFIVTGDLDLPIEQRQIAAGPAGQLPNVLGVTDHEGRLRVRWRGFEPSMEIDVILADCESLARKRVFAGAQRLALRDTKSQVPTTHHLSLPSLLSVRDQVSGTWQVGGRSLRGFSMNDSSLHGLPVARRDADGYSEFTGLLSPTDTRSDLVEAASIRLLIQQNVIDETILVSLATSRLAREPEVAVNVEPGTFRVAGRVTDEQDRPLAKCNVIARRPRDGSAIFGETNDSGEFAFDELECDEWDLVAANSEMRPALTRVRGAKGESLRWDLAFECGHELRGRLKDRDGAPLADWIVFAEREDATEPFVDSARTDEQGLFRMCGVPHGAMRVLAVQGGGAPAPTLLSPSVFGSGKEVEFELDLTAETPHGSLQFQTVDHEGRHAKIEVARAWRLDSNRSCEGEVFTAMSSTDSGSGPSEPQLSEAGATFEQLLPGWYRIEVFSAGRSTRVLDPVHVLAGETTDLGAVQLAPPSSLSFETTGRVTLIRHDEFAELRFCAIDVTAGRPIALAPGLYEARAGRKSTQIELAPGQSRKVEFSDSRED